jgi:hypothetical protein
MISRLPDSAQSCSAVFPFTDFLHSRHSCFPPLFVLAVKKYTHFLRYLWTGGKLTVSVRRPEAIKSDLSAVKIFLKHKTAVSRLRDSRIMWAQRIRNGRGNANRIPT